MIIELHPGEGGQEAEDFAHELAQAIHSFHGGVLNGLRLESSDPDVEKWAGVHRIQRVPKGGKLRHSSFVTVVALQTKRTEVRLDRKDVRVDTYRDSGPGGQHRNKTDSAVRLTHTSGIVVTAAEDRSQHVNRRVAWERLRQALSEAQEAQDHAATNASRQEVLGQARSWTWTAWRDRVVTPYGSASMGRVLAGKRLPW